MCRPQGSLHHRPVRVPHAGTHDDGLGEHTHRRHAATLGGWVVAPEPQGEPGGRLRRRRDYLLLEAGAGLSDLVSDLLSDLVSLLLSVLPSLFGGWVTQGEPQGEPGGRLRRRRDY